MCIFRAVPIKQLFNFFLFFSPRNTGNISKVWKFNRGEIVRKASHSKMWKKRWKIWKYQKLRENKSGNIGKTSFDKNV